MRSHKSLLLALLVLSCSSTTSSTTSTGVQRPWKLELATSGGLTGRGFGTIRMDSDGTAAVGECTSNITDEDLQRFDALLAHAKPDQWKQSYVPENKCCDRFEYALTLEAGGKTRKTAWIDDPLPMPGDLTAIGEALQRELRARPCGSP